jgi:hypothetical protein
MANIDVSLAVICEQRQKRLSLILTPPNRYDPVNPYEKYPQYTQRDFDMRRKAEILKYDKSSSQSNSKLTKAQKWSKIVDPNTRTDSKFNNTILYQNDGSGNYSEIIVKYPDTYSISQVVIGRDAYDNSINMDVYTIIPGKLPAPCPTLIYRPSYYSDVPGRNTNLYLDENVPLVYYNTNVAAYGIVNPSNNNPWTTVTKNNIFFSDSVSNLFMNLVINNSIKNYAYTFSIQTPISLYFTATLNSDVPDGPIYLPNNNLNISGINIFTYYNGTRIPYQTQPVFTPESNETLRFDISFNKGFVNNTITLRYYLGTLNISNLYLLTAASYVYDIELNFAMTTTLNAFFNSYFDTFTVGIYCNVDSTYSPNIIRNINLQNRSVYPLTKFQFYGS